MTIEIILNGSTLAVSKQELFDLAASGKIGPDTPVNVNGKLATAGKIKGIIFHEESADEDIELWSDDSVEMDKQGAINIGNETMTNLSSIKTRCIGCGFALLVIGIVLIIIDPNWNASSLRYTISRSASVSHEPDLGCYAIGRLSLLFGIILIVIGLVIPVSEQEKKLLKRQQKIEAYKDVENRKIDGMFEEAQMQLHHENLEAAMKICDEALAIQSDMRIKTLRDQIQDMLGHAEKES